MNLSVDLAGVTLKNPVMAASGTFGSGQEFSEFVDLNQLGAVVTKGVANIPWAGNPTPRVAEVYGGMLNAVGLQNPGIDLFIERDIPFLKKYDTKIIVNVCGKTTEDYLEVVERLADQPVDMLEINISCPNVKEGGIAFGQDPRAVEAITKAVKEKAKQPVIMKLSPNVTDITEMARAAEAGGADVYLADPETFDLIGSTSNLKDLSTVLPEDIMEKYADKLVYATDEETKEEYPCGIEITGNEWTKETGLYSGECVIGAAYGDARDGLSEKLISYILGEGESH